MTTSQFRTDGDAEQFMRQDLPRANGDCPICRTRREVAHVDCALGTEPTCSVCGAMLADVTTAEKKVELMPNQNRELIDGLSAMALLLERHPELPPVHPQLAPVTLSFFPGKNREKISLIAAALADGGKIELVPSSCGEYISIQRNFGNVRIEAYTRCENVCRRSTKVVTVAAHEETVSEWECDLGLVQEKS